MTLGRREEPTLLTFGGRRATMVASVGEAARRKLNVDGGGSEAPPAKPRAPAWAAVFGDPFGAVDLARAAAHRHGSELNMVARVSIFADQNSP
jgi:hypothetical protein